MRHCTDDELLTILAMRDAGKSFAEIAKVFGVTRQAIAGLVKRMSE